jgi:guanylate kinase
MTGEAETMSTTTERGGFGFEPGGFLLLVSGPSGVGKGTLVRGLIGARPECRFAVSATTRTRRPVEGEGVEYEFVSREEFERRIAAKWFLEWAEVHGERYGTPVQFVDDNVRAGRVVVLDVDVQGGVSVRRARPDSLSVFIMPPTLDALRERLAMRNTETPASVERRLAAAPAELAQYKDYDFVVMNDDRDRAIERLVAIVDAERARVHRLRSRPELPKS